jgi:organic hydroperoxide reductase OsmC/OhrA
MADPKATAHWKQPAHLELMDSFSRSHTLRFEGGIRVGATDNFIDEPPLVDRYVTADAAFAAALASSYAMTFLYVAMQHKVDVAECEVYGKQHAGHMVAEVTASP